MSAGPSEPGSVQGAKVFITYRREETAGHAGRLYDAMVSRFGESNVFMDVDMAPGVDFVERISEAVAACQVLIVVMGPRWATVQDEQGRARLADPEDFVRLEVETALRRSEVTPIPVLVAGARMPSRGDLPLELQAITRRNALELDDHRWRYDVGRLISTLDELLAASPLAPSPSPPERGVATGKAAPADAAQPAGQTAPPSTVAGPPPVETKPAAPLAGAGRRWRWPVLGAVAIAAIVVAVVLAVGGDGSPTRAAHFTEADLPKLVLQKEALGNLRFKRDESGPYTKDLPPDSIDPDFMQILSKADAHGYRSAFSERTEGAKPYEYSDSIAAVFPDENAAQSALDRQTANYQGPDFEGVPARDLGDDGYAALIEERTGYICFWRTGNLLQSFYLVWNGPHASEDTARVFVDEMDALTE